MKTTKENRDESVIFQILHAYNNNNNNNISGCGIHLRY